MLYFRCIKKRETKRQIDNVIFIRTSANRDLEEYLSMKSIILFGIAFGIAMAVIWSIVFVNILGTLGIGVGIGLGVSFASCGFIFGYAIYKSNNENKDDNKK